MFEIEETVFLLEPWRLVRRKPKRIDNPLRVVAVGAGPATDTQVIYCAKIGEASPACLVFTARELTKTRPS